MAEDKPFYPVDDLDKIARHLFLLAMRVTSGEKVTRAKVVRVLEQLPPLEEPVAKVSPTSGAQAVKILMGTDDQGGRVKALVRLILQIGICQGHAMCRAEHKKQQEEQARVQALIDANFGGPSKWKAINPEILNVKGKEEEERPAPDS